jgi:tellurite resistance protein TerC
MVEKLRYLKVGLSGVLVFVGAKMALADVVKVPPALSFGIIAATLGMALVASLLKARAARPRPAAPALGLASHRPALGGR